MNAHHFVRSFMTSALSATLIFQAAISHADDTEIFFGGSAIDEGIRPNVLFILDDSGSMSGTRMTQLKSAFSSIINNAGAINVGVMSLNTTNGTGVTPSRLLAPVRYINESINTKLSTPAIIISGDDASHLSTGTTNITDPTLVMGHTGNSATFVTRSLGSNSAYDSNYASYYVVTKSGVEYACSAKIADQGTACPNGTKTNINSNSGTSSDYNDGLLLFRNLNVPKGVIILSAKLILAPTGTGKVMPFSVKIENTKTAAAFNNDSPITADRDFSNTDLNTNTITPSLAAGEITFDLTSKFQNLQNLAPAANPIADVSLRLRGTSNNNYNWYLGNGAQDSPRLEITWTGSESASRDTGLRFQNVAIPQGAVITSARIDFVPAASDDRAASFKVTAEDTNDAAVFTNANFTRTKTTSNTVTWTPTEWRTTSPQIYVEGPTVTGLVQTIVGKPDWCGNNSMAFFIEPTGPESSRTAFSVDAGKDLQPVLNVAYTGGNTGCLDPILDISLIDAKDDAHQEGNKVNLTSTTLPFTAGYISTRYQKVPVKQGATVKSAQIIVTPNNTTTAKAKLSFENTANSSAFTTGNKNLSNRTLTDTTDCTITPITAGVKVEAECAADGINGLLEGIFKRGDWADGNALTLMLQPTSGTGLSLRSYDSSVASSIVLRIKLKSGDLGANSYTIRDYTNGIVQALPASGGTPIVPALNNAASYLAQKPDKHKGNAESPITSSCQANYLVLLTDGEANGAASNNEKSDINSLVGKSGTGADTCNSDATNSSEKCGRSIVEWMATQDIADYEGLNTVTTHTIGFNTSNNATATNFLNSLAKQGGGTAYQAENASDLANAFDAIVQQALATNTSFVNSSAPVNSFNRADNLDQLYFALFKPSETNRWAGNLKRYRLRTDGSVATIVDADNSPAIDANTGFFKANARSFWSGTQDGSDIQKGGAAEQLPAPNSRNLYTYLGSSMQSLADTNNSITATHLGLDSATVNERAPLLKYIRGYDTDNTTVRRAMGDPIHSSPRLVTYSCNTFTDGVCTEPNINAIMGTNEGFLHSINTRTGVEDFAFMPQALLPNIKQLRTNAGSTSAKPRLYGMDNSVTLWTNDDNKDGVISGNGEFVYAYATMGRGGRNIYALNITDKNSPKMLWQIIQGTTPGFDHLGQTWSAPAKTKIKVGGTIRDVLIFGGGYDDDQDDLNTSTSTYAADDMGNAIYIVDAKTGEKLWSAGAGAGHTTTLPKMKYSIPSSVRVISLKEGTQTDPEQLADQFFVGDMGGQVWRFFINNGSAGSALVTPAGTGENGIFANIGGTTAASARRFYNEPDVALLNIRGTRSLTVNIGSGYRGHPLNEYITDRFYSLRTTALFKGDIQDTLDESDLYDATNNLQGGTSFEDPSIGWYITLTRAGEKVLSSALTVGGDLYFNTYEPSANNAACSASVGTNRSYGVSLMYATPASYTVEANGSITYGDRATTSNSGGIAGDPQLFCSGENCWILPDPSISPIEAKTPPLGKTYWTDKLDLD